jgi:hypothetical protein
MNRMLTGLCALALGVGLLTACSESRTDRVGERPSERAPSASPPSTTAPMPPSATTPPSGSSTPSGSPSSPSPSGTK